ncbi:MAG: HEAT repeat domain-containing protein [Bacteroidota bacterium]
MKEKYTDEEIIAFIEGERNDGITQELLHNESFKKRHDELKEVLDAIDMSATIEIPAHIQSNFQQAVILEQQQQNKRMSWYRFAAAVALLIIGFGLGKFTGGANDQSEVAMLRSEVQSLKEITLTNVLQRHSASERILAVNEIEKAETSTPKFAKTLVRTLNNDESPNVRYAALQALSNYMDDDLVRAELVKSLENQKDPLIQISLMSVLIEASENGAIVPIKELLKQENTSPEVKQQAEIALKILM